MHSRHTFTYAFCSVSRQILFFRKRSYFNEQGGIITCYRYMSPFQCLLISMFMNPSILFGLILFTHTQINLFFLFRKLFGSSRMMLSSIDLLLCSMQLIHLRCRAKYTAWVCQKSSMVLSSFDTFYAKILSKRCFLKV